MTITSFSHTTILYGSAHKKISEYTTSALNSKPSQMARIPANVAMDIDNNLIVMTLD